MPFVYILKSGDSSLFKIGFTTGDVDKRIKSLNTGNPSPLAKFDVIETPEASLCETYLHQKLRTKKFFGSGGTEFFSISEIELTQIINETREFIEEYLKKKKESEFFSSAEAEERVVVPSDQLKDRYRRLLEIRENIDNLQYERDLIEFEIKIALGTASTIDGIATWKSSLVQRFDQNKFKSENEDIFKKYVSEKIQRTFKLVQS